MNRLKYILQHNYFIKIIAVFVLLTTISKIVGLNFAAVAAFFFIFISIYNLVR